MHDDNTGARVPPARRDHSGPPSIHSGGFQTISGEAHEAPELLAAELASPSRRNLFPKRKREEGEMDMTPMVDVTFLLLIFFMVTASFTMQKSLNVPKPESAEPGAQAKSVNDFIDDPDFVVVRVDGYNTFHISAASWDDEIEAPSVQELLVRLRQAKQGDAQGRVPIKLLVIAHVDALHERVVAAIDAGNEVGMEEVRRLTTEDDDF